MLLWAKVFKMELQRLFTLNFHTCGAFNVYHYCSHWVVLLKRSHYALLVWNFPPRYAYTLLCSCSYLGAMKYTNEFSTMLIYSPCAANFRNSIITEFYDLFSNKLIKNNIRIMHNLWCKNDFKCVLRFWTNWCFERIKEFTNSIVLRVI